MLAMPVAAQTPPIAPPNTGTVILMTGTAEIEVANDEAVASFFYEAQDADLTKAQGLVNQRVGDGTAALKRVDPKAQVETSGYSSYPVYSSGSARSIVGWRVRQGVTLRTENLSALPRTVSSVQSYLALGGIDFRLSRAARDKVDAQLIQMATANLNTRFASAANAMGSLAGAAARRGSELRSARRRAAADDDAAGADDGVGRERAAAELRVRALHRTPDRERQGTPASLSARATCSDTICP